MSTYKEILDGQGARILISGDSLSYNRYSYDPDPRDEACRCGAGMGSWSFALRDRLMTSDPAFTYGEEIEFDCESIRGIDNSSDVPFTAMLDGRIKTLYPKGDVHFRLKGHGDSIVLYFQKRFDTGCVFDILVDGKRVAEAVDTTGDVSRFAGYEPMAVCLPCDANKEWHSICLSVRSGERLTVVGAGSLYREVIMSGVGGKDTQYFIQNFDERIGAYQPDLVLLCLSANDRIRVAPAVMRRDMVQLFSKIFEIAPRSRVLLIAPPASNLPDSPNEDRMPYVGVDTCRVYDRTAALAVKDLQKQGFDTDILFSRDIFEGLEITRWRADDIHMTKEGNELLLRAVCERLGI